MNRQDSRHTETRRCHCTQYLTYKPHPLPTSHPPSALKRLIPHLLILEPHCGSNYLSVSASPLTWLWHCDPPADKSRTTADPPISTSSRDRLSNPPSPMLLLHFLVLSQSISQSKFVYTPPDVERERIVCSRFYQSSSSASLAGCKFQPLLTLFSAKLHYTDTGYGHVVQHHQRTSSQQFCKLLYNKFATSECQSPTSRHVKMLGCGKLLSVGGEFVVQEVVELL